MKNNKSLFFLTLLLVNCIVSFSQPTVKIISDDARLCESGTIEIVTEVKNAADDYTIFFELNTTLSDGSIGKTGFSNNFDKTETTAVIDKTFPNSHLDHPPFVYTIKLIKIVVGSTTFEIENEEMIVYLDDKAQITIGTDEIICGRSFLTNSQSISPDATYTWSCATGTFDDANKLNPTFTGTNTTEEETYTLYLKAENGACKDSDAITQEVSLTLKGSPTGVVITEEDVICAPKERPVNLTFEGGGNYSYQLTNNTGDIFNGTTTSNTTSKNINILDNDIIQLISLTDEDSGCEANTTELTGEKTFINETPNTSVGDYSTVCGEERSLVLNGSDNANTNGEWTSSATGVTFANASQNNTSVYSGTYQEIDVTWTETTENLGCVNNASASILFSESPTLTLGKNQDQICENSSTFLPLEVTGNSPWVVAYTNSNGKSYTEEISSNNHNITINGEDFLPGTYKYSFTDIIGSNGCITNLADTTFNLHIDELPYPIAGENQTVCGKDVELEATYPLIGVGLWVGKGTFVDQGDPNTSFTALNFGEQDLKWIVVKGVCIAEDIVSINFLQAPYPVNAGSDTTIYVSTATTLNALPLETGMGQWAVITGNSKISEPNNPKSPISNLEKGEHLLTWTGYIENSETCESIEDELTIISNDIIAPSGISPNGDGFNDVLKILGAENITNNKLMVFNKLGKLIYSEKNYKNNWSAIDNSGSLLTPDTYYYTFDGDQLKTPIKNYLIIKYD